MAATTYQKKQYEKRRITSFDQLCEKKQKFCHLMAKGYVETDTEKGTKKMIQRDAYVLCGYKGKTESHLARNAATLYQELKPWIMELREEYVSSSQCASLAMKVVEEIMLDAENRPDVRLKAAQDILHRTGYDQPKEINIRNIDDMSEAEIDEELEALIGNAGNVERLIQTG